MNPFTQREKTLFLYSFTLQNNTEWLYISSNLVTKLCVYVCDRKTNQSVGTILEWMNHQLHSTGLVGGGKRLRVCSTFPSSVDITLLWNESKCPFQQKEPEVLFLKIFDATRCVLHRRTSLRGWPSCCEEGNETMVPPPCIFKTQPVTIIDQYY